MQIASIFFTDLDSGEEGWAGVRVVGGTTGLTLSLKKNGDIGVFFGAQVLDQLIEALQQARAALPGAEPVV
jgi:hypothetical protein